MQRYDHYIREYGETGYQYTSDMQRIENGDWVRYEDAAKLLADRDAEIERLRADLAWAVLGRPESYARRDGSLRLVFAPEDDDGEVEVEWDGTPESIYLAVREAMGRE